MKKIFAVGLILIAFLAVPLYAVGTATVTAALVPNLPGYATYTVAWTSTAGGTVSGNNFTIRAGRIIQLEFTPGLTTSQPTDLYDLTLLDARGADYLLGSGANLSNATPTIVPKDPALAILQAGTSLDLVVANAGNAKSGTVVIWVGP